MLAAIAIATVGNAAEFTSKVLSWSGPWNFTPVSEVWEPAILLLKADQKLRTEGANKTVQFTIVSEINCTPGWWLTGQRMMTIDGALGWNSYWDSSQFLRVDSTIRDLDSGNTYQTSSGLFSDGRPWGGQVQFDGAARHLRFTDVYTLSTGPDGRFAEWVQAHHYMAASQTVPEPGTIAALLVGISALTRKRRRA